MLQIRSFSFIFKFELGQKYKFAVKYEIHDRTETNFAHQEIKWNWTKLDEILYIIVAFF